MRWAVPVVAVAVLAGCGGRAGEPVAPVATAPPTTDAVARVLTPRPDAPVRRRGTDVAIVGDSLTVGVTPFLGDELTRRGWRLRTVDAEESRRVDDGLSVLARMRGKLPSTVVVALGTNNLAATARDVHRWLATARSIVGDRRLVWVNLMADHPGAARINRALAAAARRYDVEVADWQRWAASRGVTTRSDGIHYDDADYRLRAVFYAAAITGVASTRAAAPS